MTLNCRTPAVPARHRQHGMSGVLVIMVLVLLASLSTYAVGLITSVHSGFATELNHTRATHAAEAGLEWARFRLAQPGVTCPAIHQQNLALPGTLAPYTVSVTCFTGGTDGTSAPATIHRVVATACNLPMAGRCPNTTAPSTNYVERQLTSIVAQ